MKIGKSKETLKKKRKNWPKSKFGIRKKQEGGLKISGEKRDYRAGGGSIQVYKMLCEVVLTQPPLPPSPSSNPIQLRPVLQSLAVLRANQALPALHMSLHPRGRLFLHSLTRLTLEKSHLPSQKHS